MSEARSQAFSLSLLRMPSGRSMGRWVRVGGFAFLDQGLFASTSFVVTILLARWLSPGGFGAFTLAFSLSVLLMSLHGAALTEPMGVFGAGKYSTRFRSYVRFLLSAHVVVSAVMSLLVAGAALVLFGVGSTALAHALVGLAVASPFALLLWLLRRAFYVRFATHYSALAGGVYALLLLGALLGLKRAGWLSPMSALLATGAASLLVCLLLLALLWTRLPMSASIAVASKSSSGKTARWHTPGVKLFAVNSGSQAALLDHARYARWALPAAATAWLAGNIHYFVLSSSTDLTQTAAMRALDTLIAPYWQFLMVLQGLLLPLLASRLHDSVRDFSRLLVRLLVLFSAQALVFWCALALLAGPLMSLLYPGKYASYAHLLPILALVIIPETLSAVLLSGSRAAVRTGLVFFYNTALAIGLIVAVLVAGRWGLYGIIIARLIVSYGLLVIFFRVAFPSIRAGQPGSRSVLMPLRHENAPSEPAPPRF